MRMEQNDDDDDGEWRSKHIFLDTFVRGYVLRIVKPRKI